MYNNRQMMKNCFLFFTFKRNRVWFGEHEFRVLNYVIITPALNMFGSIGMPISYIGKFFGVEFNLNGQIILSSRISLSKTNTRITTQIMRYSDADRIIVVDVFIWLCFMIHSISILSLFLSLCVWACVLLPSTYIVYTVNQKAFSI